MEVFCCSGIFYKHQTWYHLILITHEEVTCRNFKELPENEDACKRMSTVSNPYGDGFA